MHGIGPHHLMIMADEKSRSFERKAQQKALLEEVRVDRPSRITQVSGQLISSLGTRLVGIGKRLECYSIRMLSPSRS